MKKKGAYLFLKKIQLLGFINNTESLKLIEDKIDSELDIDQMNVLIIEDHIQIAESYALIFGMVSEKISNYDFVLDLATSCEEAIFKLKSKITYDIIFLDIRLPSFSEANIYSGEDIILWIDKNLSYRPKIIINTTFHDDYRLYNLYKNINPDGFLTKLEADSSSLLDAIVTVLESPPYYSNTVLNMVRRNFSKKQTLDDIDRRILYELSLGATTKNLTEELPYGKTSIEKRKKGLFELLEVENNNLKELLAEAKRRGFI
ncbi:DNA-binding response regulator [Dokdonia ponticola]|uniref:DNA-binding response regulator n=1 Tax=Dokdonia ponticola TaxID=2041041 RepID=A0ABV9I2D1_9FLAO